MALRVRLSVSSLRKQLETLSLSRGHHVASTSGRVPPEVTFSVTHHIENRTTLSISCAPFVESVRKQGLKDASSIVTSRNQLWTSNDGLNSLFNGGLVYIPAVQCVGTVIPKGKIDVVNPNKSYDCPIVSNKTIYEAPTHVKRELPLENPGMQQKVIEAPGTAIEKLANRRVTVKRRKIRIHRRRRQREKRWSIMRKVRFLRKLKKARVMEQRRKAFEKRGDEFDAMEYVMSQLNHARTRGFYVNVLGKDAKTFRFRGDK